MLFTKKFLVFLILLFLVVVFLDQNSVLVPVKFIVGGPVHVPLTLVILLSILAGMVVTLVGVAAFKRLKTRLKKKDDFSPDI